MGFNIQRVFAALLKPKFDDGSREGLERREVRSQSEATLDSFHGQGTVEEPIRPQHRGRVGFQGTSWYAICQQNCIIFRGEVVDVIGMRDMTLIVEPAFLLKASGYGLERIDDVANQRGWTPDNPDWLSAVSQPLEDDARNPLSIHPSLEPWKRFLQGKPIHIDLFKTYCNLLDLPWKEMVGFYVVKSAHHVSPASIIPEAPPAVPAFVGREDAIADLRSLTTNDIRVICILGEGGLGKTALARRFFAQENVDKVLEYWIGKNAQAVTSVESMVQDWLQRDLGEQPGQQLSVSLERLRNQLQTQRIGIAIDNLESVLDRNGMFCPEHRDYVALLHVLSDPTVQSTTLITSREPLHEPDLMIHTYGLKELEESAWQQFFSDRQIVVDTPVLQEIHRAFGGNAKAMNLLSSTVRVDYEGDLEAYWQDHHADLRLNADLENLVNGQFERLQYIYPEAYRLLCRMGCYRYQDIPRVPLAGLFCLLWDVPHEQHQQIVKFLKELSLVEVTDGEYWLHTVIQLKAIALLKASEDWVTAHQTAAQYWSNSVAAVETTEDALRALEAYYHYRQIDQPALAADVILQPRDNRWENHEPLGVSFYRLGLLKRMIAVIMPIIDRVETGYALSKLHNIWGDLYWLTGYPKRAIACHQKSREVAIASHLKDLEIVALFNIGLCQIELGEIQEALKLFKEVNALAENTEHHKYAVGSWFCLAYLYSCLNHPQEALQLAKKVSHEYPKIATDSWSRGYSLLFLGHTLKNLGDHIKAEKLYNMAKAYANESHYTLVKAGALNGLAEIERDRSNFEAAISHHLAAKELLEAIEANGDLAEVYYQMGITQQKMLQVEQSQDSFRLALQLFEQIGAVKQAEKVRHAM
jgi:tetratricopeptide (TPR) repeat protein